MRTTRSEVAHLLFRLRFQPVTNCFNRFGYTSLLPTFQHEPSKTIEHGSRRHLGRRFLHLWRRLRDLQWFGWMA